MIDDDDYDDSEEEKYQIQASRENEAIDILHLTPNTYRRKPPTAASRR